jgi:carboxyl-terminal processing protease
MRKRLMALFLALCLSFSSLTVYARPINDASDFGRNNNTEQAQLAGWLLSDVIELILEEYAGGDVALETLVEAALRGMTDVLDPYSEYFGNESLKHFTGSLSGQLTGIGVVMRQNADGKPEVIRVLPNSPAQEAGIHKGDIITTVNGQPVDGCTVTEIAAMITDSTLRQAFIKVTRGKRVITFNMTKRAIPSVTVFTDTPEELLRVPAGKTTSRYIAVTSISENTAIDLRSALADCKKNNIQNIILDFRGNGGGYLDVAVEICNMLVPKGPIYHTVDSKGSRLTYYSRLETLPLNKIAVLVDQDTASAAELIAAALQDAGAAVIIGETTYGKGVIQTLFPLRTGGALKLTTEEYLRRSGETINGIGVTPDILIENMDRYTYETTADAALLAAFKWLA